MTLGDIATDFIPGVSNLKDAYTALTGENPVTGEKVGVLGRIASGIFAIPGVGNVAKYVGKGGKLVVKGIAKAGRKIAKSRFGRAVGKKAKQAWDWLKKKFSRSKKSKIRKGPKPDETPRTLAEQLTMQEARAGAGEVAMRNLADEPRLVDNYGPGEWVKMQHTHQTPDGRKINIHWFRNQTTGQNVEFKFKNRDSRAPINSP